MESELSMLKRSLPVPEGTTTPVRIAGGFQSKGDVFLPTGSRVEFTLEDGNEIRVQFDRDNGQSQLAISGIRPLMVIPEVSNSIRVTSYQYNPATGRRSK